MSIENQNNLGEKRDTKMHTKVLLLRRHVISNAVLVDVISLGYSRVFSRVLLAVINFRKLTYFQLVIRQKQSSRVFCKKVFLKISQNSQESTHARVSFLIKLQARPATLLKRRLWHRCFPLNFAKFSRAPFFIEHLPWLLVIRNC